MMLLSLKSGTSEAGRSHFEERYLSMLHLLESEFHSIRPELATAIPADSEAGFRDSLLQGIREFLEQRRSLR